MGKQRNGAEARSVSELGRVTRVLWASKKGASLWLGGEVGG